MDKSQSDLPLVHLLPNSKDPSPILISLQTPTRLRSPGSNLVPATRLSTRKFRQTMLARPRRNSTTRTPHRSSTPPLLLRTVMRLATMIMPHRIATLLKDRLVKLHEPATMATLPDKLATTRMCPVITPQRPGRIATHQHRQATTLMLPLISHHEDNQTRSPRLWVSRPWVETSQA
jgi:hypothetical protein